MTDERSHRHNWTASPTTWAQTRRRYLTVLVGSGSVLVAVVDHGTLVEDVDSIAGFGTALLAQVESLTSRYL